jgi:hypothetical protein
MTPEKQWDGMSYEDRLTYLRTTSFSPLWASYGWNDVAPGVCLAFIKHCQPKKEKPYDELLRLSLRVRRIVEEETFGALWFEELFLFPLREEYEFDSDIKLEEAKGATAVAEEEARIQRERNEWLRQFVGELFFGCRTIASSSTDSDAFRNAIALGLTNKELEYDKQIEAWNASDENREPDEV